MNYALLGLIMIFACIFTGLVTTIVYLSNKNKVKEYKYIQIEIPIGEKNPINKYKTNASTGNIPHYNSINV